MWGLMWGLIWLLAQQLALHGAWVCQDPVSCVLVSSKLFEAFMPVSMWPARRMHCQGYCCMQWTPSAGGGGRKFWFWTLYPATYESISDLVDLKVHPGSNETTLVVWPLQFVPNTNPPLTPLIKGGERNPSWGQVNSLPVSHFDDDYDCYQQSNGEYSDAEEHRQKHLF